MIRVNGTAATRDLMRALLKSKRNTSTRNCFFLSRGLKRHVVGLALGTCATLATAATQAEENYPNRPLRLVVAQSSGGGTDIAARLFGEKLGEALGERVVVDNRPGAGGIIGTELVASAAPNGYTLIMVSVNHTTLPSLHKTLPYDPIKDFSPISRLIAYPFLLAVHPSVPAKSVSELISVARAKPGQINYASGGNGSSAHLHAEVFKSLAGVKMVHVPYKGTAAAVTALVSGEAQIAFYSASALLPHVKAGRLHALATTGDARAAKFPNLPTVAEAGLSGFKAETWAGMLAPAQTPKSVINRLNGELIRILHLPDVKQRLSALGFEAVGSTPEAFHAVIREEVAKWLKVVKQSGAKAG